MVQAFQLVTINSSKMQMLMHRVAMGGISEEVWKEKVQQASDDLLLSVDLLSH